MGKLDVTPSIVSTDIFPARPSFGTKGKPIVVWANYFRIHVKPVKLYKYTVSASERAKEGASDKKGKSGKASASKGTPKEVKGRKLHLAIQKALEQFRRNQPGLIVATEFKSNIFTLKQLNADNGIITVELPRSSEGDQFDTIDVKLEGSTEVPLAKLLEWLTKMDDAEPRQTYPKYPDAVDALNGILGTRARSDMDKIASFGSKFFPFGDREVIQALLVSSRPLVAARGYFQSTRLGTGRLLLNVNITHSVFKISGRLDEIFRKLDVQAFNGRVGWGAKKLTTLNKFLQKTRVMVTFKVNGGKMVQGQKTMQGIVVASALSRRRAQDHPPRATQNWEFPGPKNVEFWRLDDNGINGRYVSIYDHYREKYGKTLNDRLPVIQLGNVEKPVFFPAEYITIPAGQKVLARLTGEETTDMLRFACRTPFKNALSISTDSREILELDNSYLNDFGITVDKHLLAVHARILSVPTVKYRDTGKQTPMNGSWNMQNVKVYKSGPAIRRWSWVNILFDERSLPVDGSIVQEFGSFMRGKMGIGIDAPTRLAIDSISANNVKGQGPGSLRRYFELAKAQQITHVLVILSKVSQNDRDGVYNAVKAFGDCDYGIQTSCVVAFKFAKSDPGYFANVGLKWNLKGGGVNHKIQDETGVLKDGRTMIAGYDVTHPTNMMDSRRAVGAPSVAGLVASVDRDLGQWPSISWEQASRQEMLDNSLTNAFISRIQLWKKHNKGECPSRIIIFRDGVSEGQFSQVLDIELPLIREAMAKTCPKGQQPKLSIVVSVKRHQTRFFPTKPEEMTNSGNIKNGTVVDRGITQARYWDFFLTAHNALQGTARPAHYTVLLDEVFRYRGKAEAANELEKLTHELCYLFGRATKAVSICPPAYYADIVCERARAHRPEWFGGGDTASESSSATANTQNREVHENLKDTMYYI
ncbi:hypothetical protein S7711_05196 [Stachybotrys chartarum IBT 7711]|uniref:Piwi domain-containing protein n=1 Tax=Stachybotrys chartarum (strain CBS 109288 / IBT 7711) TaxID=1280523 RepID=A0A084ANG3_STACB|nr:hypothetical protein S7711_05196 [Stachybotrys chartarum IBT 7711]